MNLRTSKNNAIKAVLICFGLVSIVLSQFSGSNLLEYQLGNLPEEDPGNLTTLYDQLNLSYRLEMVKFATKIEWFQSADQQKEYAQFVQKSIQFKHAGLGLTVGNFYHMIGRGLLLRSYEIPGAILEDNALRTRYGFYRDMEGFLGSFEYNWLDVKAFRGRPLNNVLPPTQERKFRRPNLLEGLTLNFLVSDLTVNTSYMRDNYEGSYEEYGAASFSLNLPLNMQFYGEHAHRLDGYSYVLSSNENSAHAFYSGFNTYMGGLGLSIEYKNYNQFDLGYNDPPPLVKEHQYLLLNRSTHSTESINETGWQAEAFYGFNSGYELNVNWAEAVNDIFDRRYIFQEQFVEFTYHLNDVNDIKGYVDRSKQTLFSVEDQYTSGIYWESEWLKQWGSALTIEYQTFKRVLENTDKIKNAAASVSLSRAPGLSFAVAAERSDDSNELPAGKSMGYWLNGTVTYQYNRNHLMSVFYGKRRGGRACTSGLCYEILPFEGFEFRLNSNL
jgi:hypothetical protein